jgi:hypothetical protein
MRDYTWAPWNVLFDQDSRRFCLPDSVPDCKLQVTVQLSAKQPVLGIIMRPIVFLVVAVHALVLTSRLLAGDTPDSGGELTKMKSDYADVLALQGTAKGEILAIAKILRAKPKIAVDQTAASGEYCFNSGLGTMVHFATRPEGTAEDVVYEFDASGLIAAGLDPSRLQQLPERGRMTPGVWYFLPKGQQDPHHAHAMANPTIAIAINVK